MNTQDLITKSIVLKTVNYQENDKILTMFSVDFGKISATLKGCRKSEAKLKCIGQPFCFAEFSLAKKGDRFVVTNASEIETFFSVTKSYDTLKFASAMIEMTNIALNEGEPNADLFLALIKALKEISKENQNVGAVFVKFALHLFKNSGYALQFLRCGVCGGAFNTKVLFDFELGNFVCGLCKGNDCKEIGFNCLSSFKILNSTDINRVSTVKISSQVLEEMLEIITKNFELKFNRKIKSLS